MTRHLDFWVDINENDDEANDNDDKANDDKVNDDKANDYKVIKNNDKTVFFIY